MKSPSPHLLSIFVVGAFLLSGIIVLISQNSSKLIPPDLPPPNYPQPTKNIPTTSTFYGTIKTGEQLGEVKNYCKDGYYLVADEGQYIADEMPMLLLLVSSTDLSQPNQMFSDPSLLNRKVEVSGKYPAKEAFCLALMCQCEPSILIQNIVGGQD